MAKGMEGGHQCSHYQKLALEITHQHMCLHTNCAKSHSALLIQLRMSKMGFMQMSHSQGDFRHLQMQSGLHDG